MFLRPFLSPQSCAACSGRMIVNCPSIPSQDIIEENQGLDNILRMNSSSWGRVFGTLSKKLAKGIEINSSTGYFIML